MSKNIVLVGMMGCGKTTVGKILAEEFFTFSFVDLDSVIEKNEKCSINEIFKEKGETYFRQLETDAIKKIPQNSQIISTGGGICQRQENIDLLRENGVIFYLKTDQDELILRLKNDKIRPLLVDSDIKNKITELLNEREINYQKADIIIDTANKKPLEIAQLIMKEYKSHD